MQDLAPLYDALKKADAAGNKDDAQKIAAYIQGITPADDASIDSMLGPKQREQLAKNKAKKEKTFGNVIRDAGIGFIRGIADIGDTALKAGAKAADTIASPINAALGLDTGALSKANADRQSYANAVYQNEADTDSNSFGLGRVGGNIAITYPVGGALGQGAKAVGATRLGNALASGGMSTGAAVAPGVLPNALNMGIRMLGGAGTGAASAALIDPQTAGTGAVIGAALPPALKTAAGVGGSIGRGVKALAEPFYDAGKQVIVGRVLNSAAGADAPEVANRLRLAGSQFVGPSQPGMERQILGELVPGSIPTVAQAAANPGIAAIERAATATNPEVSNALANRFADQNTARVNVLERLSGSDGARDFYGANRSATAEQLYQQAFAKGLDIKGNPGAAQKLNELMNRPAIQSAIEEARTLAANEGIDMASANGSVKGLDYVKRALDDKISAATGNEKRILTNLKENLVSLLDALSPDYAAARKAFTSMSRPINQMDTAAELMDKSVNRLTGNLQPAAYAKNLTDATAQRATGFKGATLEGVFDNAQLNQLNSLLEDLQRSNAAQTAGRGVGSDTVQKLAYSNMLEQSGVPTFIRNSSAAQLGGNVLARGADVVYGRQNKEIADLLARTMQDPESAARLMDMAARRGISPGTIKTLMANLGVPQIGYRVAPVVPVSLQSTRQ